MKSVSLFAGAAVLLASLGLARAADVAPAQPVIPNRTFNLADYGAVPDGLASNTAVFREAVAAVNAAGGGALVVPAGTYLTGPIDLCSRLNLRLEAGAIILFSPDPSLYETAGGRYRPLLEAVRAHDVMISGPGTIDGSGWSWWGEAMRFKAAARARHSVHDTSPRPRMVVFDHCERVRVEDVTLTDSPVFNLVPMHCRDVTIDGIRIYNPSNSPNTDGIDPSLCQRVLIARCRIDTGDDCIAIKSGGRGDDGVRDVLITDCTFLHGHGCSLGSETSGGVRNVTVRNCTFDGTDIGVRFKSDRRRGGLVEGVTYSDLTMNHVGQAIVISSQYQGTTTDWSGRSGREPPEAVTATTPRWRDIVVRNLTATAGTKNAGLILGLPEMPAENITLENVRIEAPEGLRLGWVRGLTLRHVQIIAAKGPPLITDDTVTAVTETK